MSSSPDLSLHLASPGRAGVQVLLSAFLPAPQSPEAQDQDTTLLIGSGPHADLWLPGLKPEHARLRFRPAAAHSAETAGWWLEPIASVRLARVETASDADMLHPAGSAAHEEALGERDAAHRASPALAASAAEAAPELAASEIGQRTRSPDPQAMQAFDSRSDHRNPAPPAVPRVVADAIDAPVRLAVGQDLRLGQQRVRVLAGLLGTRLEVLAVEAPERGPGAVPPWFPCAGERIRIGRGGDMDVALPVTGTSRHHADLMRIEGRWRLNDRSSLNGTFLNGDPVRRAMWLRHGDRLVIGRTVLAFVDGRAELLGRCLATALGPARLTGLIGNGSYGSTWRARVDAADAPRLLAITALDPGSAAHPRECECFLAGAGALTAHEALVPRHPPLRSATPSTETQRAETPSRESQEEDGLLPCAVQDYMPQGNLADRFASGVMMTVAEALHLAERLAAGLAALPAPHRGLRPNSVLYDDAGQPRLGGAGLCAGYDSSHPEEGPDPRWISPEEAAGQPCTADSNRFSLGLLLYQALSGQPPFAGATRAELAAMRLHGSLPSLAVWRSDVPQAVEGLIARLLARAPQDRPRDWSAVQALIQAARQGDAIALPPRGSSALAGEGSVRSGDHLPPPSLRRRSVRLVRRAAWSASAAILVCTIAGVVIAQALLPRDAVREEALPGLGMRGDVPGTTLPQDLPPRPTDVASDPAPGPSSPAAATPVLTQVPDTQPLHGAPSLPGALPQAQPPAVAQAVADRTSSLALCRHGIWETGTLTLRGGESLTGRFLATADRVEFRGAEDGSDRVLLPTQIEQVAFAAPRSAEDGDDLFARRRFADAAAAYAKALADEPDQPYLIQRLAETERLAQRLASLVASIPAAIRAEDHARVLSQVGAYVELVRPEAIEPAWAVAVDRAWWAIGSSRDKAEGRLWLLAAETARIDVDTSEAASAVLRAARELAQQAQTPPSAIDRAFAAALAAGAHLNEGEVLTWAEALVRSGERQRASELISARLPSPRNVRAELLRQRDDAAPPLTPQVLINTLAGGPGHQTFAGLRFSPRSLHASGRGFALEYVFDAGADHDGIVGTLRGGYSRRGNDPEPQSTGYFDVLLGNGQHLHLGGDDEESRRRGLLSSSAGWRLWPKRDARDAAGVHERDLWPQAQYHLLVRSDVTGPGGPLARHPTDNSLPNPIGDAPVASTHLARIDAKNGSVIAQRFLPGLSGAMTTDAWGRSYLASAPAATTPTGRPSIVVVSADLAHVEPLSLREGTLPEGARITCMVQHGALLAIAGSATGPVRPAAAIQTRPAGDRDAWLLVLRLWP